MGVLCVMLLASINDTDWGFWTEGITTGVAMAPTSVGIALTLLMQTKQLNKDYGQVIIAAAFLDDILSLAAFSMLFALDESGGKWTLAAFIPLIVGIPYLIIGGWFAAKVAPGLA